MDSFSTERLCLRRFRENDRARLIEIRSQPEVAELLGHRVEQAGAKADWFLAKNAKCWSERGAGAWAVLLRDSGELIGHAGLWDLDEHAEFGLVYGYCREAWGRGIATEAGCAILRVAFEELGLDRIVAIIDKRNLGSRRVAEKLGFRDVGDVMHRGLPMRLHEIVRSSAGG